MRIPRSRTRTNVTATRTNVTATRTNVTATRTNVTGEAGKMNKSLKFRCFAASLVAATSVLTACGEDGGGSVATEFTKIEDSGVDGIKKITLTEGGQKRIDLKTVAVRSSATGVEIPYSAVIYDPAGATWVFVGDPAVRTYQRNDIVIERIDGEKAMLSSGPAEGALVVSQGAAQLYGSERGMGH